MVVLAPALLRATAPFLPVKPVWASLSFHDGVSALKCLVDDDGVGVVLELSAVIVGAAVALRDEGVLALVRVARLVRSHVVGHLPSVSVIKVTKGASVVVVLVHPVILIVISFVISRGKCIVVAVKVPVFVSFVEFAHFPDCHIIIIPSKVALPWFIVVAGEIAIKIAMRVVIVIVSVVGALARSVTVWDVVVVECRVVIGNSRAFGPVRPLVHVGDFADFDAAISLLDHMSVSVEFKGVAEVKVDFFVCIVAGDSNLSDAQAVAPFVAQAALGVAVRPRRPIEFFVIALPHGAFWRLLTIFCVSAGVAVAISVDSGAASDLEISRIVLQMITRGMTN